jgi:hypothetical protein
MPMSEHQMRQILDWFHSRVGRITCSVCGHMDFKFDSELTAMPVWRSDGNPRVDFSDDIAAVILSCTNCASIRFFSAEKMGLIPTATQRAPATDLPSRHKA